MISIGIIGYDPALRMNIVNFIDIDTDLFLYFSCNILKNGLYILKMK